MEVEHVFKALADHHRRHLIDLLAQQDGQNLNELCAHLPMSRVGVMKHLRILEDAGLITTRKVGRERLHYLNAAPIQDVVAWANQYRQYWEARMDRLDAFLRDLQDGKAKMPTPQTRGANVNKADNIKSDVEPDAEPDVESDVESEGDTDGHIKE